MKVLVLNAGSSTLKFQIIETDLEKIHGNADIRLCRGTIEGLPGDAEVSLEAKNRDKRTDKVALRDTRAALEYLARWFNENGFEPVGAVGHRVVHGGDRFSESALIDASVLAGIEKCSDLAPLHNSKNLEGILAARDLFGPSVPQVAVFDTAFHQTLPQHAFLYALPMELYSKYKIRRYGFHGTSHRYVAHRYRVLTGLSRAQTNIITLHLGNGCSATAIKDGNSIDTSMGMTPLEGLVMGTRSGDLDPSIVNVIAEKESLATAEVERLLNTKSGLLGISGHSNDMRTLQELAEQGGQERAQLAIEMFCYRARKYVGAFLAAMGGADAVVFTGGIGENSPPVREKICAGLAWAGLRIDTEENGRMRGTEGRISTNDSTLAAYVIPTDEELLIARDTVRVIHGVSHPS